MNFNKKVKGFFISSLTALVAVCGVAFGVTYKNAAVKADETNGTVIAASELSKDVRAVYDAFNVNPLISGNSTQSDYYDTFKKAYKVEYVQNATINGQTVSGLRFTVDTNVSGKRVTVIQPSSLKIDTSALSWDTSMFGFMMESRENKTDVGFELGPTLIGEDGQGFRLKVYESDIKNGERSAIRAYVVNGASNNTVATDVNSGAGGTDVGGYYGANYVYSPSVRKWVGNTYVDTFAESATAPFNFYYDNATNVAYCDASGDGSNTGWHLIRMFSEDPANYATHASPFPSEAGKSYGTGTGEATKFLGFKNNSARLGIRLIHGAGIGKYSFILTSYAGLDLTNPQNTVASDKATLQLKDFGVQTNGYNTGAGGEVKLPEAHFANAITHEYVEDFVGQVKVYKARRSSGMEYTAWGATVTADELGEAVATVSYGENYTFENPGEYTLEYVQGDKKLYVDVKAVNPLKLKLVAYNATLTDESGNLLETGAIVYSGQTVKVVPNEGYTLLNVGTLTSAGILIGDKANANMSGAYGNYRVLSNGSYVIQESDESTVDVGVIDIGIAAYKTKYNVKFYKNAPEDATQGAGGVRDFPVYKDVPAGYTVDGRLYCVYNPKDFKPTEGVARWNNNFGWDGNVLSLANYNWMSDYNAVKGVDPYAEPQLFGYKVTYGAGSAQTSSIYKIGGNNQPTVDSDVTIEAALIRSFVDYTKAKIETNGTIGLSVKLGVSKPDYDRFARMLGDEMAFNMNAVITTGTVLDGLAADHKNAFHVTRDNPSGCVQAAINRKAVTTETYNGKEYYVYTVKGVNIPKENYAKDYVFGGYIHYNCQNGGHVVRFGQGKGGKEFEKINVYKAACTTFGEGGGNVTTDPGFTNSCVINGLTYYSDTLDERGIYFAVKYYYVGMYLTFVKETETAGYAMYELNGKTYYYDQAKVNSVDIIRAIKFYHGVSLAEEV